MKIEDEKAIKEILQKMRDNPTDSLPIILLATLSYQLGMLASSAFAELFKPKPTAQTA